MYTERTSHQGGCTECHLNYAAYNLHWNEGVSCDETARTDKEPTPSAAYVAFGCKKKNSMRWCGVVYWQSPTPHWQAGCERECVRTWWQIGLHVPLEDTTFKVKQGTCASKVQLTKRFYIFHTFQKQVIRLIWNGFVKSTCSFASIVRATSCFTFGAIRLFRRHVERWREWITSGRWWRRKAADAKDSMINHVDPPVSTWGPKRGITVSGGD